MLPAHRTTLMVMTMITGMRMSTGLRPSLMLCTTTVTTRAPMRMSMSTITGIRTVTTAMHTR